MPLTGERMGYATNETTYIDDRNRFGHTVIRSRAGQAFQDLDLDNGRSRGRFT